MDGQSTLIMNFPRWKVEIGLGPRGNYLLAPDAPENSENSKILYIKKLGLVLKSSHYDARGTLIMVFSKILITNSYFGGSVSHN